MSPDNSANIRNSEQSGADLSEVRPVDLNSPAGTGYAGMKSAVEALLNRLPPGKELLLDEQLKNSKRHQIAVLTFNRTVDGEFLVTNGINSMNGTHVLCGNSFIPVDSSAPVKAGDVVKLGDFTFQIPAHKLSGEQLTDLQQRILELEVGESQPLGRSYFSDMDNSTSRRHATIIRTEDVPGEDGGSQRLYIISDSVKSEHAVFVDTAEGSWEAIDGKKKLGPGRKLRIGEEGGPVIEIPDLMAEINYSQMIKGEVPILQSMRASMAGMGSMSPGAARSISFRAPEDLIQKKLRMQPEQAQLLGLHIREGLVLIRQEHYEEAKRHFENKHVLAESGFTLAPGNMFQKFVDEIDGKSAYELLQRIASRSWFTINGDGGTVTPSFGSLIKKGGELSAKEQEHLKEFHREVCLIYAEEWTHAFQHALGSPVSKKGVLLENLSGISNLHEHDVAEFFKEQKVPMSPMFKNRYDRQEALDQLQNYASEGEQAAIRGLLALSEPGTRLRPGRNPSLNGTENQKQFSIATEASKLSTEQQAMRILYLGSQVREDHVEITVRGAGKYLVHPLEPGGKVFERDSYGIWREVKDKKALHSGTCLRLGTSFEFKLP